MAPIRSTNKKAKRKTLMDSQREAIKWFISTLRASQREQTNNQNLDPNLVLVNRRATVKFIPGQIYFWRYDPKHKDTLAYYDTAPLVILLDIYEDGFLGINTHYLPYDLRIKLIKALLATITAKKWDHKTKANINYQMVKSLAKYDVARVAIKRYLFNHMRSKVVRIQAENWENVAYLPIEKFVKATSSKVWRDTQKKANKR
jgi:hypothetical protein